MLISDQVLLVSPFMSLERPSPRCCDYANSEKVKSGQLRLLHGYVFPSSPDKRIALASGCLWGHWCGGDPGSAVALQLASREGNVGAPERMGAPRGFSWTVLPECSPKHAPEEKWRVVGNLATSPAFKPLTVKVQPSVFCILTLGFVSGSYSNR